MPSAQQELEKTRRLLEIEHQEELALYKQQVVETPLEERRKQGVTWFPVLLRSQETGFGEKQVLELERTTRRDTPHAFESGSIASLFNIADNGEYLSEHGVIARVEANSLRIVLDKDNPPDWIDEGKLGLDLYFDETTFREMKRAIQEVISASHGRLAELRDILLGHQPARFSQHTPTLNFGGLNPQQVYAVQRIAHAEDVGIIHGPPGTGKTTTMVEAIVQTLGREKQVLVCAPSNIAVDLLTEQLAQRDISTLRLGHPARITEAVLEHTLDAQVSRSESFTVLKKLRQDIYEIRKKALKYKRSFGKNERETRRQMLQEVRNMRQEARVMEKQIVSHIMDSSQAIACTLVGAASQLLKGRQFRTVFIDEAAQALEPGCWIPIIKAERVIFAGDHWQLPPTIKSLQAARDGLAETLFEKCIKRQPGTSVLLTVQYRMHTDIMGFSSKKFYEGKLEAAPSVAQAILGSEYPLSPPLEYIDTAGCSFEEEINPDTRSYRNRGEADILNSHINSLYEALSYERQTLPSCGVISPYSEQVRLLDEILIKREGLNIHTVDGFQGQERDIIYVSLVRCNDAGEIGFLSDIRRMNVAMTRAKQKLVIIGDSATIANHSFYRDFLEYVEKHGVYRSAWELMG